MAQLQLLAALLVISVARQTQAQLIRCENSNYTFHGSKCYKTVLEAGKTYGEAKSGCESDGGRLAVMATPVEAIAILSSIALMGRFGKQNAGGVICACATAFGDWNSERKHPAKEERSRKMIQWRRLLNFLETDRGAEEPALAKSQRRHSGVSGPVTIASVACAETTNQMRNMARTHGPPAHYYVNATHLRAVRHGSSEDAMQQNGLWIGLNDRKKENVYEWEDSRQIADSIDLFGQREGPNNPGVCEDCGRIQQNMWWTRWSCRDTSAEGYVCEMDYGSEITALTDCPSSGKWNKLRNKCFYLAKTSNQVDFFHAQGLCQQQHPQSNLAKIESMSELNRIVSLKKDAGLDSNDALWFGATDFVSEGSFVYPDGSAASPIDGSHVFSAPNEDKDFCLLKQDDWLTEAWNYGDASGYVCSIDIMQNDQSYRSKFVRGFPPTNRINQIGSSEDAMQQNGLWIGLNDRKKENVYEWEDNRQIADSIDLFGQREGPNNPGVCEDCGRIQQNMWWTMWSCRDTSAEGYVCEMDYGSEITALTDCPSSGKWNKLRNKCFYLAKTSNQVDFFHAQGLCQQQHPQSNLAKIESMSELNRIVSLMKDAGLDSNDALWFGATDFVSEGSFVYPDGSAASPIDGSHVFSAPNEDKDFCLLKQDEWLTEAWNYGDASGYVCSIDITSEANTCFVLMLIQRYTPNYVEQPACERHVHNHGKSGKNGFLNSGQVQNFNCPEGYNLSTSANECIRCQSSWQTANGATKSCYTLSEVKMSWNDAKADCENNGMHLVALETEEESQFIFDIVDQKDILFMWVGANKQSGEWRWEGVGLTVDTSFSIWGFEAPAGIGNCTQLQFGDLYDSDCDSDSMLTFMCEYDFN
ncbi:hypothetical protein CAPTEDRAFT_226815 [Capitella teleta]|uniref:C-type lectin domain-containing protein n=1 Tax=Capitella teleta TaxID=283909 RepID=R7TVF0_CAPTE|nr:hypothetical protein CAPTEDRAFT_226815 [Capitella teleta]|eukprot:ELT97843.1 hypothetical protein CAPTEDRAFT_226815 [Capitella teleta]